MVNNDACINNLFKFLKKACKNGEIGAIKIISEITVACMCYNRLISKYPVTFSCSRKPLLRIERQIESLGWFIDS